MSLQSLLDLNASREENNRDEDKGVTEERLRENLPALRDTIAYFRQYPDIFIDSIKGEDCKFEFYYYQRIMLRAAMRHRKTYFVFSRGFSKSFLAVMCLMIKAILYPNSELFVTTGGKNQAAAITLNKIDEICKIIPAIANEINWERGVSKHSKDEVKYIFKNGSYIDVLPALESSRGQRRTAGLFEECVLIDPTALNEIIIPCCVINRRLSDGTRHENEIINQGETYITTAGYKDTYAYTRLIELLAESVLTPDEVMVMGGTWEIPVNEGLQPKNFIENLKLQGSFDESSFEREWNSRWVGDSERAYYSSETFDKNRILMQPEYEYSGRLSKNGYYVLGVDVGRHGCTSEVSVIKVTPQPQGSSLKSVVCFYSMEAEHFGMQAIFLKKLYYRYKARTIVIDGNGLGTGLIDFMVMSQDDPTTGDYYPAFGVEGGTYENASSDYKKFKTDDMERDAMYIVKANAPINTEAHTYVQTQLSSGKVKFLIEEREARAKLGETKVGQTMSVEEKNERMIPFQLTDNLKNQMLNLIEDNEGINVILKQNNRCIPKDRFSSLEYGLYYIKLEEDRRKKRSKHGIADLMLFN